jgi:hypothetical protein
MKFERLAVSHDLRSSILAIDCIQNETDPTLFASQFEPIFRVAGREISEAYLLGLLKLLTRVGHNPVLLEAIICGFLASQNPEYRLGSKTISWMIACHLNTGGLKSARRWLDHHP